MSRRNSPKSKSPGVIASHERLLIEAVEALRGAENLSKRIYGTLQFGNPAVADLAYAIKIRVKDDLKVVEKVLDRRAGGRDRKANPRYGVRDVTDLLGLRIITLYRLDMLEVIEALFAKFNEDDSSTGTFIKGSVAEIKIYSTNPNGDVQDLPKRVSNLCGSYGFSTITTIEDKPSNYSSIHILVSGRGKYGSGYRTIPIEIQVRTALEDVWGQIEHTLKYKNKDFASAAGSSDRARLINTLNHLGALKTMVDGISQYADQIKLQIEDLQPEVRSSSSKIAEDVSERLRSLKDVPEEIRTLLAEAIAESKPALVKDLNTEARLRILRSSLLKLDEVSMVDVSSLGLKARSAKELKYIVTMHQALVNLQIGNLTANDSYLHRAVELYREMEAEFPARTITGYRLALALDAVGFRGEAIEKLQDICSRLKEPNEPTPADHWVRSAAPRILGVLLWEEAKSLDGSSARPKGPEVLGLLREALRFSQIAYEQEVFDDPLASPEASEKLKAANNLVYFLAEYAEAGGPASDEIALDRIVALLGEIGAAEPGQLTSLRTADTARRVYAYLGDGASEKAAAGSVLRAYDSWKAPVTPAIREAVRAAEAVLTSNAPGGKVAAKTSQRGDRTVAK